MTNSNTRFNLVDDPWIELGDHLVSIREALLSGHELPGWPSGEPTAGPVIIRLLMPIVYRIAGMDDPELTRRRFADRQARLLRDGKFDAAAVDGYLDQYRDRFWLTAPPPGVPPFAQDRALVSIPPHPVAELVTTWASGDNPSLGPHAPASTLDHASATRCLLIAHNYSREGTYTGRPGGTGRSHCKASRLRRSVSLHPVGSTFTMTLLHHLIPPRDGWELGCPPWEGPPSADPAATPSTRAGFLEQMAGRHDKAVLLATGPSGAITGVVVSGGPQRVPGLECPDPYLVTTANGDTYRLKAGRDAWRDIDALVIQSIDVKAADRLEADVLNWCSENIDVAPSRWTLVSHRSSEPGKDDGWGLTNLPDILRLFPAGGGAARTASAVLAAAENASSFMGKKLRALSATLGGDGRSTRYDDARSVFWSLTERTFWEAVTGESTDPRPSAPWVRQLRSHALDGFDSATCHLIAVPRAHLEIERQRDAISRWTWPLPRRNEQSREHSPGGQTTT